MHLVKASLTFGTDAELIEGEFWSKEGRAKAKSREAADQLCPVSLGCHPRLQGREWLWLVDGESPWLN